MYLTRRDASFDGGPRERRRHRASARAGSSPRAPPGAFFDLFVLMANPSAIDADVEARYLLSDGTVVLRNYVVPASSRFNVWVNLEGPELRDRRSPPS